MGDGDADRLRAFFEQLSRVAREAIVSAAELAIENKSRCGFDPVTNVDRAVEQALRNAIADAFPTDRIHGEELGASGPEALRFWSIDPIDGTRSFICGLPNWAVLVGLVDEGEQVASMIDLPTTAELFIAVHGTTILNGVLARTSGQERIEHACLSTTDPFLFEGREFEAFERVRNAVSFTRYGLDGSAYARLAAGRIDLVIESELKRHDYDALIPVVRGAGGHVGDWEGGSDFARGRIVAAASEALYCRAIELMRDAL